MNTLCVFAVLVLLLLDIREFSYWLTSKKCAKNRFHLQLSFAMLSIDNIKVDKREGGVISAATRSDETHLGHPF